jgi:hypothetical protein
VNDVELPRQQFLAGAVVVDRSAAKAPTTRRSPLVVMTDLDSILYILAIHLPPRLRQHQSVCLRAARRLK